MGSRKIVLVSTAGISVHNAGIFWREAKTKRLFSQCGGKDPWGLEERVSWWRWGWRNGGPLWVVEELDSLDDVGGTRVLGD